MSITIELEPETEAWLNAQAKREGQEPAQIVARLLRRANENGTNGSKGEDEPSAYEALLHKLRNRTPEDIASARALIQPGRPLPPGKTAEDVLSEIAQKYADEKDTPDFAFDPLAVWISMSPEAKAAMHEKARRHIIPGRPLPPGKTLEDVVWGKWPGNETDEEINAALEELS